MGACFVAVVRYAVATRIAADGRRGAAGAEVTSNAQGAGGRGAIVKLAGVARHIGRVPHTIIVVPARGADRTLGGSGFIELIDCIPAGANLACG